MLRKIFSIIAASTILLGYASFVFAADVVVEGEAKSDSEASIKTYLCTPTEGTAANNDLVYCVNKLYKFSIAIAAIASVFFLVIAGYLRMASDGSDDMVKQSTSIIVSVVAGNLILAFSYVFLRQINPEIVRIKAPVIKEIQSPTNFDDMLDDTLASIDRMQGASGNLSGGSGGSGSRAGGQSYTYTGVPSNHKVSEIEGTGGCTIALLNNRPKDKELAQLNEQMFQALLAICNSAKASKVRLTISALTGCNGTSSCSGHSSKSFHYRGCALDFSDNPSSGNGKLIIQKASGLGLTINPGADAEQDNHTHIDLGGACREAGK